MALLKISKVKPKYLNGILIIQLLFIVFPILLIDYFSQENYATKRG